jgi:hypothetical protein
MEMYNDAVPETVYPNINEDLSKIFSSMHESNVLVAPNHENDANNSLVKSKRKIINTQTSCLLARKRKLDKGENVSYNHASWHSGSENESIDSPNVQNSRHQSGSERSINSEDDHDMTTIVALQNVSSPAVQSEIDHKRVDFVKTTTVALIMRCIVNDIEQNHENERKKMFFIDIADWESDTSSALIGKAQTHDLKNFALNDTMLVHTTSDTKIAMMKSIHRAIIKISSSQPPQTASQDVKTCPLSACCQLVMAKLVNDKCICSCCSTRSWIENEFSHATLHLKQLKINIECLSKRLVAEDEKVTLLAKQLTGTMKIESCSTIGTKPNSSDALIDNFLQKIQKLKHRINNAITKYQLQHELAHAYHSSFADVASFKELLTHSVSSIRGSINGISTN